MKLKYFLFVLLFQANFNLNCADQKLLCEEPTIKKEVIFCFEEINNSGYFCERCFNKTKRATFSVDLPRLINIKTLKEIISQKIIDKKYKCFGVRYLEYQLNYEKKSIFLGIDNNDDSIYYDIYQYTINVSCIPD